MIPLSDRKEVVLGILGISKPGEKDPTLMELLSVYAEQVSAALHNNLLRLLINANNKCLSEANTKIQNSYMQTVEALRLLVDAKDLYTRGHSDRVSRYCVELAKELGRNQEFINQVRVAGLLHDIGKALDHEIEGSHVQIGVDICRKYKENTQIIHAIEAHHGDVEPKTPLAFIIQAADAISAARPGARRENVESYVKRLENLEEISSSFEGVEQAFAVQAGREVRILVKPDVISDDQVILLARSIAKKIEDTLDYPGQIKVNVIRESRAVEYAK